MITISENMSRLLCSVEYKEATASYSNAFKHGAGRQKPGTVGFALWLLYDNYARQHNNNSPSNGVALTLAREHGLNETSATNALGKWGAFNGFRKPRTSRDSIGPRS